MPASRASRRISAWIRFCTPSVLRSITRSESDGRHVAENLSGGLVAESHLLACRRIRGDAHAPGAFGIGLSRTAVYLAGRFAGSGA
jgi:hypothetical protein